MSYELWILLSDLKYLSNIFCINNTVLNFIFSFQVEIASNMQYIEKDICVKKLYKGNKNSSFFVSINANDMKSSAPKNKNIWKKL